MFTVRCVAVAALVVLSAACSPGSGSGDHSHSHEHGDHSHSHDDGDHSHDHGPNPLAGLPTSDRWFGEIAAPGADIDWTARFQRLTEGRGLSDAQRHIDAAIAFLEAQFFATNQTAYPYFAQPSDADGVTGTIRVLAANAAPASVGAVDVIIAFVPESNVADRQFTPTAARVVFSDESDPMSVIDYASVPLPAEADPRT